MPEFDITGLLPMMPNEGPPLPRFLGIYWPWYEAPEAPPELPYTCSYCGAKFATWDELQEHYATGKANVHGNVTERWTSQRIAGVTVTIDGRATTTDANGNYAMTISSAGNYTMSFTRSGYIPQSFAVTLYHALVEFSIIMDKA